MTTVLPVGVEPDPPSPIVSHDGGTASTPSALRTWREGIRALHVVGIAGNGGRHSYGAVVRAEPLRLDRIKDA